MLEKLIIIVDKAIIDCDFDKLMDIGFELDCILFLKTSEDYYPLFKKIERFLSKNKFHIFSAKNDIVYDDLQDIGFYNIFSVTFIFNLLSWNQTKCCNQ